MSRPLVLEIHEKDYGWSEGPFWFWFLKHSNGRSICRSYGNFKSYDECENNFDNMMQGLIFNPKYPTRKLKVERHGIGP